MCTNSSDGTTYPQEEAVTLESFTAYYYGGGTVIVGLISGADETEQEGEVESGITLEEVRAGRDWDTCLGGYYYVCIIRALSGREIRSNTMPFRTGYQADSIALGRHPISTP